MGLFLMCRGSVPDVSCPVPDVSTNACYGTIFESVLANHGENSFKMIRSRVNSAAWAEGETGDTTLRERLVLVVKLVSRAVGDGSSRDSVSQNR